MHPVMYRKKTKTYFTAFHSDIIRLGRAQNLCPEWPGAIEKIRCHKKWRSITDGPRHRHHVPQPCCKTVAFTLLKHSGPSPDLTAPGIKHTCPHKDLAVRTQRLPLSLQVSKFHWNSGLFHSMHEIRELSVMLKAWNLHCNCNNTRSKTNHADHETGRAPRKFT